MAYQKICEQCDRPFDSRRPEAETCSEECKYQRWIERQVEAARQPVKEHPLAEVRAEQEQTREKARWTLLVREHMARTLMETGYFHSDDLEPLGIPEEHRNIAGSQAGGFVSRKLMVEVSRRASSKPSRKKAKSAVYQITAKGRTVLTSMLAGFSDDNKGGGDAVDNAPPTSGNAGTSPPDAPVVGAESGEKVGAGQGQVSAGKGVSGVSSGPPAAGVDQPEALFPESALERMQDRDAA